MDMEGQLSPSILGIGTAIPPYRIEQVDAARRLADSLLGNKDAARWVRRLFPQCGVDTRYTCQPNLLESASLCRYLPGTPKESVPTTAERMRVFEREAPSLLFAAVERALLDSEVEAEELTHLITVSCTGMVLPGLDALLARRFSLKGDVVRLPFNYLGCAAGLKAIGVACDIMARDPEALVLIACVELCTLHLQPKDDREALFAAAFFGDGASACVVGAAKRGAVFAFGDYQSTLLPGGHSDMTWHIGDAGFDLALSPRIPGLLAEYLPEQVSRLLGKAAPKLWAIHPGGRGIVDTVQRTFGLRDEQTAVSRSVLRRYGNMSSATILFVLDEMRHSCASEPVGEAEGIALAFGPGLTIEMLRFRYIHQASIKDLVTEGAYVG